MEEIRGFSYNNRCECFQNKNKNVPDRILRIQKIFVELVGILDAEFIRSDFVKRRKESK